MSKVTITKSKLDSLATAIAAKTSATAPMTIAQMETAVSNIPAPPSGTITITQNQTGLDVSEYALADVAVPTSTAILQDKSVSFTPSETAQSQTVSADSGYDGLDEVTVSVGAISSYYVGSDITRRYSTDLTASGATITAPSGYYGSNASLTVPSGTAGTPTATKGTVSNHSVTVTPSVTNTTGYITGSTKTGTAVTVSASELVSGNKEITANGTNIDVSTYSTVSVAVSGVNIDTKTATATASTYPVSLEFTGMQGQPKVFSLRTTSQISSSGSTTYYYIANIHYNGTSTSGNVFRIGSTRRIDNVTSGYSWSYSGSTLTITSSAASRSASPGAFYSAYELVYVY